MRIVSLDEILSVLPSIDTVAAMEEAFVAYSDGRAVVPPVGELEFENPPGDVHVKYGFLEGGEHFVVKIASGFYDNPRLGLASSNGLMMLFERRTGRPSALLLDEGHLTDVRTAAAGAVAARHLAPPTVDRIGILGTGTQARLQLQYLQDVTGCRDVVVWGRSSEGSDAFRDAMAAFGFSVAVADDPGSVARNCDLVVTTTPSRSPLLQAEDLRRGSHITAVGSDTPGKQELGVNVLAAADRVVVDSLVQCLERGEIAAAVAAGRLRDADVVELGAVVADPSKGRAGEDQTTIADLTGVAVQDMAIAEAVYSAVVGGVLGGRG